MGLQLSPGRKKFSPGRTSYINSSPWVETNVMARSRFTEPHCRITIALFILGSTGTRILRQRGEKGRTMGVAQ
jgi:hypothetical protein